MQPVRRRHTASFSCELQSADLESLDNPKREGRLCCPSCPKLAFTDAEVAQHVSSSTFESYLEGRSLWAIHEAKMETFEEAQAALSAELARLPTGAAAGKRQQAGGALLAKQLRTLLKDARQCKECKWGPLDFRDCDNLSAHHDQVISKATVETALEAGGEAREVQVKIDNSCPRCGWFSSNLQGWPKWDGNLHYDALPSRFEAAELVERKVKVATAKLAVAEEAARKAEADALTVVEARVKSEVEALEARTERGGGDRGHGEEGGGGEGGGGGGDGGGRGGEAEGGGVGGEGARGCGRDRARVPGGDATGARAPRPRGGAAQEGRGGARRAARRHRRRGWADDAAAR